MTKIKYDINLMKYISLFESLTGAKLKDCVANDVIMFIVRENDMGKAIGKKGVNIRRIEGLLKKKIKLVEFNENVLQFIENLIKPIKAKEITNEDDVINIYADDTKTRGMLIGRDRNKINSINEIVKRYFKVEVKVA